MSENKSAEARRCRRNIMMSLTQAPDGYVPNVSGIYDRSGTRYDRHIAMLLIGISHLRYSCSTFLLWRRHQASSLWSFLGRMHSNVASALREYFHTGRVRGRNGNASLDTRGRFERMSYRIIGGQNSMCPCHMHV